MRESLSSRQRIFSGKKALTQFSKPRYIGYQVGSSSINKNVEDEIGFSRLKCEYVFKDFTDYVGSQKNNPLLLKALGLAKKGDVLVVNKISSLGNNLTEVMNFIKFLQDKGIHIESLDGLIYKDCFGKNIDQYISMLNLLSVFEFNIKNTKIKDNSNLFPNQTKNLGGRPKTSHARSSLVLRLRYEGFSYRSIRDQTGMALSTIRRIIVESKKHNF